MLHHRLERERERNKEGAHNTDWNNFSIFIISVSVIIAMVIFDRKKYHDKQLWHD